MKPWTETTREDYLVMLDRQWPFWTALGEFVLRNRVKSIVEVGCGIGHLCHSVETYVGFDVNQAILYDNEMFHRRGKWVCNDWMKEQDEPQPFDLFLSATTLEHCEEPGAFLEKMHRHQWRYAVVTIPERMRDWTEGTAKGRAGCHLFDLPLSRRPRQVKQVSVLVLDRTALADLGMWSRRALNAS